MYHHSASTDALIPLKESTSHSLKPLMLPRPEREKYNIYISCHRSFIIFWIASFADSSSALDRLTNSFLDIPSTIWIDFLDYGKYYKLLKRMKRQPTSILNITDDANWFEGKLIEVFFINNLRSFVAYSGVFQKDLKSVFRFSCQVKIKFMKWNQKESHFSGQHMKWRRTVPT